MWDLLHPGHLEALSEAREHCTNLTVALNITPNHKDRLPVENMMERYVRLRYCSLVDQIIFYSGEEELLHTFKSGKYDIAFISEEHKENYTDPSPAIPIFIKRLGNFSSTNLEERIHERQNSSSHKRNV